MDNQELALKLNELIGNGADSLPGYVSDLVNRYSIVKCIESGIGFLVCLGIVVFVICVIVRYFKYNKGSEEGVACGITFGSIAFILMFAFLCSLFNAIFIPEILLLNSL